MKKLTSLLLILVSALIVGCSDDSQPTQGKQYQQLPADLSKLNLSPVTEVFSLNCGHCRSMENEIPQIEKLTGQNIGKAHVTFNESAQIGAMIYYAAEMQLGGTPDHAMMEELFAATQMGNGATLTDKKAALDAAFQSRNLTSPYDFNQQQQSQLFEAIKVADEITTQGQIKAVPTFIINGKYQIITSGHKDVADIAKTITFLLSQP
ncbi:thiol-disulfide isomerase and thioredoxin [Vibrio tubiashii]|nr:thiol-disulfide isomerase and thioredoxin [Vibrio tubiashii]